MLRPFMLAVALVAPAATAAETDPPYVWSYQPAAGGEPARLSHGIPDSDGVDVMLWCEPGRGRVSVTLVLSADARGPIGLSSGSAQVQLAARHENNELTEGVDLTVEVPAGSPVMARFAATGALSYRWAQRRRWVPTAKAPREAAAFLSACRGR